MKKTLGILIPIAICFVWGGIASHFQTDSVHNWYPFLEKPPLDPPNSIFPIAWSILYVCMGVSIGLVINSDSNRKKFLILLFSIQLLLNFAWSFFFFVYKNPLLGAIDILLLEGVIIYYACKVYPVSRVSAWLFVPYILWVAFATYLNIYILIHN
ncbi:MAG: tryptophan-rich sensory protein [Bacteroides sp.]|nr:tryptophan-rich sensory protein [Bacteroides sp.]